MITITNVLNILQKQSPHWIDLVERQSDTWQVLMPICHPDGDMVEIFISPVSEDGDVFEISDCGLTLMKLSYSVDVSKPEKKKVFDKIFFCNNILNDKGEFYTNANIDELYSAIIRFVGAILTACSIKI